MSAILNIKKTILSWMSLDAGTRAQFHCYSAYIGGALCFVLGLMLLVFQEKLRSLSPHGFFYYMAFVPFLSALFANIGVVSYILHSRLDLFDHLTTLKAKAPHRFHKKLFQLCLYALKTLLMQCVPLLFLIFIFGALSNEIGIEWQWVCLCLYALLTTRLSSALLFFITLYWDMYPENRDAPRQE